MKLLAGRLRLSATDLANHLACRHLTSLDRAAAEGRVQAPMWKDPALEILQERGFKHEAAYLEFLAARGQSALRIEADDTGDAFERTRAAMREGRDVIVQATLSSGRWHGRADVLLKVQRATALGDWGYEVVDTKLSRETRGGTMLQLCAYSDIVGDLQGAPPEHMHVIVPGNDFAPESYKVREYLAYYRHVRRRLEAAVDGEADDDHPYPEPVDQCEICRWWQRCDRRRHADDHLSLVAGISRLHRRELQNWQVGTLADLAVMPIPLRTAPRRGSKEGFVRVREQARVQLQGRTEDRPVFELLAREPMCGLARLPEPSPGDVFLDLEGDPFVEDGGLEFLFGIAYEEGGEWQYQPRWALGRAEERRAFEGTVDFVIERWERFPGLHVYHYGDYEKSALKRLMGRHASREEEIDRLLRAERFVDLHTTVKQAVRASVEKYSIKDLEQFYEFRRGLPLEESGKVMRAVQWALERGGDVKVMDEQLRVIEIYNRDDCVSAGRLREWLETLRARCIADGEAIARPESRDGMPSEALSEKVLRRRELAARLLAGLPLERTERSAEQQGQWLLAHMLEWHRREEKAPWWEYFRLIEASDEELMEEEKAIGGLQFVARVETIKRSVVDRYQFPRQEVRIKAGEKKIKAARIGDFGDVVAIDVPGLTVDIKKGPKRAEEHPTGIFAHDVFPQPEQESALERLAQWVDENGIDAPGDYRAARDLLVNRSPRLAASAKAVLVGASAGGSATTRQLSLGLPDEGGALHEAGEDPIATAVRVALSLDGGVLPIQGPPGAGKTYAGARVIRELVRAGKKVGVTATSHKVISHLLVGVLEAAREAEFPIRCVQKPSEDTMEPPDPEIAFVRDNTAMLAALRSGDAQVVGGTAWLWSRADFQNSVDVLVIDEAGQFALANALAVSQAAHNLVLLGDPQQLDQPVKGSHPAGAEVSCLEHVLHGHETMPADRGLFLPRTWRLHPEICAFTSEVFYDGRLESREGLECQALVGGPFSGSGVWFVPVEHEGNQNASAEEVEAIEGILQRLVSGDVEWIDEKRSRRPMTLEDVLIVAPYNAQVSDLKECLPHARVGTVDKFQGQEAPVVFYSMTSSTPEDAPRGMDFLYSMNRLNVATSRARCACILVGNPQLFEPECKSPKQMKLANAFCRYREMARVVPVDVASR